MPMTNPKHRPGAKLRPEDLPAPARMPSRPADKRGREAGLHWRAWKMEQGVRTSWHVVVWDRRGTRIDAQRTRSGPQYPRARRHTRPYHLVMDAEGIPALCRRLRRKQEIPTSCRRLWTSDAGRSRLDVASAVIDKRAMQRRWADYTDPAADDELVTQRGRDGTTHTALAHEL